MPRLKRTSFALLASLLLALTLAVQPAAAQSLDSLRASGALGERFDGLAVARDGSAAAAVAAINEKRTAVYGQRAASQGVSVQDVGRIYAKEILGSAAPGTWFQKEDGSWVQK